MHPLQWTETGPTNDPWMISDEFKTTIFDVGKLKPKYLFKKLFTSSKSKWFIQIKYLFFRNPEYSFTTNINTFIKIQNIRSKKLFIFLKSWIFIFLKEAVSPRATRQGSPTRMPCLLWYWWCSVNIVHPGGPLLHQLLHPNAAADEPGWCSKVGFHKSGDKTDDDGDFD